jgi:phenylacetate-CoA ligase
MPIWTKRWECIDREELRQVQLERLQATVNRAYKNVRFYHRQMDELGLAPEEVQSLDDLLRFPFTTKDDLREGYPYQMFAVPLREIVRIHASSGTTGRPTVCGYTKRDLQSWAELVARILTAGGVTRNDVVQIFFGYGIFTGAFGHHYGAEEIGASVIPASAGGTERQIQLMQDFRTTALVGTPSYALYIAETMDEMNVHPEQLSLRVGLFGAEPWSERMREAIESKLHITASDNYGLSEIIGPGVSGECEHRTGLHINEDHFLVEIIDPQTGEVLEPGQEGELVITTLTKEAMPLLRYRTRDLTRLDYQPCPCGRTTARMARVHRRTDDMIIYRGVNIYPSQVEAILAEVEGTEPHFQIVLERKGALDEMEIQVEMSPDIFPDAMRKLVEMEEKIRSTVTARIGISPRIKLVEPKTLERTSGKAKRVIDRRPEAEGG